MAKSKMTRRNRNNKSRKNKRTRVQRGGNGYGYNGSVLAARNGMAPIDIRSAYSTCNAPQRGGGCGCGLQRGGGTDGYYSLADDNSLGKVPVYGLNPCVQRGGNAAQQYGVASYNAGYGFAPVYTNDVPFMAPVSYGNSCKGGYRKTRKAGTRRK